MSDERSLPASPSEWQEIGRIFMEAVELTPDERGRFLDEATRDRPHLLGEVKSLLKSHEAAGDFLETPPLPISSLDEKWALPNFSPGDSIDNFSVIRLLGRGSFAAVYLAQQVSLGREVALKISPHQGEEARTMAPLEHDNIVRVFSESIDTNRGLKLLCMQYVAGVTLETLLQGLTRYKREYLSGALMLESIKRASPTPGTLNASAWQDRETLAQFDFIEVVLFIGRRLADALAYAHEKGVLHLDIKPENILVSTFGRPLLTDFNVALRSDAHRPSSTPPILGGTLTYMAPEHRRAFDQARRGEVVREHLDSRTDIYSLGLVLKQMFERTGHQNLEKIFRHKPEPRRVWTEIGETITRATAENPRDRFGSAGELANALQSCLERWAIAKELPTPNAMRRWELRHPKATLITQVVLPQFVGSAINITYNTMRIGPQLTAVQNAYFQKLILLWNPFIYPIGIFCALQALKPVAQYFARPHPTFPVNEHALIRLRHSLVELPVTWGIIITVCWMSGAFVFPAALHWAHGPLPFEIFLHFFVSFSLSWLVALTYASLFSQTFAVRALYFPLCAGCLGMGRIAREELDFLGTRLRFFHFLAGFVPLLGAILIVANGPDSLEPHRLATFRSLTILLIGLGIIGFLMAFTVGKESTRALMALKGGKVPRETRPRHRT
jgi:serine/threonine protein kinase